MPFDSDTFVARFQVKSCAGRAALLYGFAAVLSMACVAVSLQLQRFDPRYPYDYGGDGMLHATVVKAIVEQGWYQHIDRLSAPAGLRLEDFPLGDNLCCALLRLIALGTSNSFLVENLFFLGLFPVTAVVAVWTLRRFGLSAGTALLGGVLYALLPYHLIRGVGHLFLGGYFLVPPICLVAWWAMSGSLLASRGTTEEPSQRRARRWRIMGSIVPCALIGCNAVYYPFFACVLLAVAGVYTCVARRDWRHGGLALLLAALIGAVVVINLLPTILYVRQHGPSAAGVRGSGEAETYGLKLAELFLPVTNHQLRIFKAKKDHYIHCAPLVNENDWSGLGVIGGAGLAVLLFWAVFKRGPADPSDRETDAIGAILGPVSVLNLAAILLGMIGGFSSLFALLVSPQIRAYNRISVFIAFFALLASAAVLEYFVARRLRSSAAQAAFFIAMVALIGIGAWDQTPRQSAPDYDLYRRQYTDDAQHFARIESALPSGAMVFQLPATPFPEAGPLHEMDDYSHLRGYVQTRTLRWSGGAMRGRSQETWNRQTAALPPGQMLPTLTAAGFRGLYLDGSGYADHGASEIAQFSAALGGAAPLLSRDGLTAFFDLTLPIQPDAAKP